MQADFKNCPDIMEHIERELEGLEIGILGKAALYLKKEYEEITVTEIFRGV